METVASKRATEQSTITDYGNRVLETQPFAHKLESHCQYCAHNPHLEDEFSREVSIEFSIEMIVKRTTCVLFLKNQHFVFARKKAYISILSAGVHFLKLEGEFAVAAKTLGESTIPSLVTASTEWSGVIFDEKPQIICAMDRWPFASSAGKTELP